MVTAAHGKGMISSLLTQWCLGENVSIAQKVTGDAEEFPAYSYIRVNPDWLLQDKNVHTGNLSATDIPSLSS